MAARPERKLIALQELTARPGQRVTGYLSLGHPEMAVPICLMAGTHPGPRVAVVAGLNGSQYSAIAAARRLMLGVGPSDLSGQLLIIPVMNIAGFYGRSVYVNPQDGKNINRVFPGRPDQSGSDLIAWQVTQQILNQVDILLDFHSGELVEGLSPFTVVGISGPPSVRNHGMELARSTGLPMIVTGGVAGTLIETAADAGKPALALLAGQFGQFSEEAESLLTRAAMRVLAHCGLVQPSWADPADPGRIVRPHRLHSPVQGVWYAGVSAGEDVTRGTPLGWVEDIWGNVAWRPRSPVRGRVLHILTGMAVSVGDSVGAIAEFSDSDVL